MNGKDLRETVQAMQGLPWAARALYLYLATYGSPCWPSVATLARELGTAERYVRRLLKQLERAGVLERVDHQGRPAFAIRTYRTGPMSPDLSDRTYRTGPIGPESGPMSPDLLVRTYESGPMSPESGPIGPPNRTYESGPIGPDLLVRTYESGDPDLLVRGPGPIGPQKEKERPLKEKTTTRGSSGAPDGGAGPADLAAPDGAAAKPLPGPKSGKADKAGKAAKQESGEKPPLPIRLYRHYCQLNPNQVQARAILAEVSDSAEDIRAWKQALEWSRMKGIDRADVAAILAAYRTIKSRAAGAGGDGTPAGRRYSYAEALDLWERRGRPGGVFPPDGWKMITENGKAFFMVP